ncbi:MAG TPA: hypothetical protein VIM17_07375, partial [Jatrophihabitantaceae bacterium]
MLLPELQQVASGLGLSTTKVKKSDLVAAIQAARAGSGSAAPDERAARTRAPAEQQPAPDAGQSAEPRTVGDSGEQGGGQAANGRRTDQQQRQNQGGTQNSQNRQQNQSQGGTQGNQNRQQNQGQVGGQNSQNRQQNQGQG